MEITIDKLKEILENHMHWLKKDCEGWEEMRANLSGADLYKANLSEAYLYKVNLYGANLREANLREADLYKANLNKASLGWADLYGADLRGANLSKANLYEANLSCADLYGANLREANLSRANLCEANLNRAKGSLIEFRKGKILTENIIGYKKCRDNVIVTLEIPRGAIVFAINGNKCRTNKARVIAIDGADRGISDYCMSYYVGDEFNIYDFNCQYNIECAEGIHFFMTREEAEEY